MGTSEGKFQYFGTIAFRKLDHSGICFGIKDMDHLFFLHDTNNNYIKFNRLIKEGNKVKIHIYRDSHHKYIVKHIYLYDINTNDDTDNIYDLAFEGKVKHIGVYDETNDYYQILFEIKECENSFYIKSDNITDNIIEGVKYDVYCNHLDMNKYEIKKINIV